MPDDEHGEHGHGDHEHGHEHSGSSRRKRGTADYVRDYLSNWKDYEGSLGKKVALTIRNRTKAYSPPFEGCCGNRGEPGC